MAERNLNILITATDKASKQLGSINSALEKNKATIQKTTIAATAAFSGLALLVGNFTSEALKAERVTKTFDSLTASIGADRTAIEGLRKATLGLVDDTSLMQAGNKFMAMGLANSTDEMNRLSNMAVRLGSAMGTDATESMDQFALLLANQSIPRLDTFGISSGVVRDRINELMDSTEGMTRETAFMTAVMEQGEVSLAKLGDTQLTTDEKLQALNAQFSNLKNTIGDAFIPLLNTLIEKMQPIIERTIAWIEQNPELTRNIILVVGAVTGLVAVMGALTLLFMAFNPLSLIVVGAVAGLSLVFVGLNNLLDMVGLTWGNVWEGIKDTTVRIIGAVLIVVEGMINFIIDGVNRIIKLINIVSRAAEKAGIGGGFQISTIERVDFGGAEMLRTGNFGGTNVNVTVNGDVSGQEIVDKVASSLMGNLSSSVRLTG